MGPASTPSRQGAAQTKNPPSVAGGGVLHLQRLAGGGAEAPSPNLALGAGNGRYFPLNLAACIVLILFSAI
jgi:hypothetical protein